MKRHLIYIIMPMAMGFAACDPEGFLDTPVPSIDQNTFFANENAAKSTLVGAYDPAGWMSYIQYLDWAIGDVASDDAIKGGGGDSDQPEMYDIEHFRASPEQEQLSTAWQQQYEGINRANRVIAGVKGNANISEAAQRRFIAEARFMRGYYHFCLMKVFGAVPLVDHLFKPSEYKGGRASMEDCWAFVEADFKAAMQELPHKKNQPAEDLGRATWGSAAAFLTKCYIWQEKWKEAEALAKEIVASGDYSLQPNYGDLFTIATDNGVESVFDVQLKDFNMTQWGDENEGYD